MAEWILDPFCHKYRQNGPSVETLPLPTLRQILEVLRVEWRSSRAERRGLPQHQSEEMKILNILYPRVGIRKEFDITAHNDEYSII